MQCLEISDAVRPIYESLGFKRLIFIIIIIIIIIRHQLDLHRPISALSNSPFKDLPNRLRPFGL